MKTILITVDDKFWDDPCLKCPATGWRACKMTFNTCPLANAKEAVEVCKEEVHHDIIEEKLTDDLGKRVKLYAVAVDK